MALEVEEWVWIARNQLDDALAKTSTSQERRGARTKAAEMTGSLAAGAEQSRSPEVQALYDRHRALNLLVRELRRFTDLPVRTPEAGFSRPKLSPELEASYRSLNFDPLEAYYSFRRVKAAVRSNDVQPLPPPGSRLPDLIGGFVPSAEQDMVMQRTRLESAEHHREERLTR